MIRIIQPSGYKEFILKANCYIHNVNLCPPQDFILGSVLKLLWISLFRQGYLITSTQA